MTQDASHNALTAKFRSFCYVNVSNEQMLTKFGEN